MESTSQITTVIDNVYIVTMNAVRSEITDGYVIVQGNKISEVGEGPAPIRTDATMIDGTGCVLTPGLINTHHHLYQWITRGLAADNTLFEWLQTLYPIWAGIDAESVRTAATGGLARLATSGCSTTTDHLYVFPHDGGDVLGAEIAAAADVGIRFHPCRGSMDLGVSAGGLPPDNVVEKLDAILTASNAAVEKWHDPSFDSMLRIALAPCSPFSVTTELLTETASLSRELGVRMHTHLAETVDEEKFCAENFGSTPVQYMESLGWTGPDVWFAHAVHLDDAAIATMASSKTGAAHCPTSNARLGAGIARTSDLLGAGVPVGLGVDGAASNESCSLIEEVHHAVLFARARGGPRAMTVRNSLEMATIGGAEVLGREREIGSIEAGKLADIALWRIDGPAHAGITDPVVALVLGAAPPLERLLVNGVTVVESGRVSTVDEETVAAQVAVAHTRLVAKAG